MLALDIIENCNDLIIEHGSPKTSLIAKGVKGALDKNREDLKNPEYWTSQKQIVLAMMGFIPPAMPYIAPAALIFDIIIKMVEVENAGIK